jgi:hypothetical protein
MYVYGKHLKRDGTPIVPMIDENWPATNLPTLASCDAAEVILKDTIGRIETSLAAARDKAIAAGEVTGGTWFHRARTALRFKRAALRMVQEAREKLLLAETQEVSAA